ncbi:MAG: bifunctional demethylmenaquinone methyltransferase/2-methoxy-6-polyprenyl-1,4-benzoquinol methylase UbiE [Muribaculum sp.]|nr:bifunctional demethylmenaquinone methyltransferase/2-methoxy-6-polyprenyl-1,4-benzoquinol methylase UbiE [Muribaculum sp.]
MEVRAELVNPYDNNRCKTEQVREMFDSIAPAYDFMNRMMTFGIDKLWRAKAVKRLKHHAPKHILDVATGTGDLALLLCKELKPKSLTGIDLSYNMIEIARKKAARSEHTEGIDMEFRTANCLNLPFAEGAFDCVTVAYGVRNFERLLQGYKEMFRVLSDDGVLCVIELSTPTSPLVKPLYDIYTKYVIPMVGRIVSRDVRAYSYLPESIAAVPQGESMAALMREAGFRDIKYIRLTFGTCTIYMAKK